MKLTIKIFCLTALSILLILFRPAIQTALTEVSCNRSLFLESNLSTELKLAQREFYSLVDSFEKDSNVDTIFEVPIEQKSPSEIEQIITESQSDYFLLDKTGLTSQSDGFSQRYFSTDGEWIKTIKVTTKLINGNSIIPYLQIFYEDKYGGVIRLKPYGNPSAPAFLPHLKSPHGTFYFKLDSQGDLSWSNEAFKVYGFTPLPKTPQQVKLPDGVTFATPEAESFLRQCWTFKTHIPLGSF